MIKCHVQRAVGKSFGFKAGVWIMIIFSHCCACCLAVWPLIVIQQQQGAWRIVAPESEYVHATLKFIISGGENSRHGTRSKRGNYS